MFVKFYKCKSWWDYDILAFEVFCMGFTTIISVGFNIPTEIRGRTIKLDDRISIGIGPRFIVARRTFSKDDMTCREIYVDYAKKGLVPDDDAGYKVMSKLNDFLNGDIKLKAGAKGTVYNVNVIPGDAKGGKMVYSILDGKNVKDAANASLTITKTHSYTILNATINKGTLAETIVGETLGQVKYGEDDDAKNIFELTGGQYGESVADFGNEISKLSDTAARYAAQRNK